MLAGLKQTPVGTVIYDQISQIAHEHHLLRSKVDQTYEVLLHLLLEAYAQNPSAESVTRLNAQLIRLRSGEPASLPADPAPPPPPTPKPATAATPEAAPTPVAPERAAPDPEPPAASASSHTERRVNTAYRLHLDRKRDEIEKLQETLSQGIREAISQNREFGALLQIELSALKQAEGEQEMETLRHILIGGIEELINGQHLLESKLNQTGGYLNLIKADSERLRDELHKVRLLSLTDEFTGLPNRRAFMRRLQDEIGRGQRYGTPLALVLIDLDEFKAINDAHGHGGGDEVLRCYAGQVLTILRHHDMVARYGGEEFAVMLPNTTEKGAVAAMHKARERSRETVCQVGDKAIQLPTFSAGVAMYQAGESPTDLIERADRALYAAKSFGRDRIEVAPSLAGSEGAPAAASSEPQETS
jgi:diguanylate cyclase (GGDEF)-like protein